MPRLSPNDSVMSDAFADTLEQLLPRTASEKSLEIMPRVDSETALFHDALDPEPSEHQNLQGESMSDTMNISIIQTRMDQDSGSMIPQTVSAGSGKRAPGRKGPLAPAARRKAHYLRGKACEPCRRRKASVSPLHTAKAVIEPHFL